MAESNPLSRTVEPVIVRSPIYQTSPRDSTAFDRRSVGPGIFQFREAQASQNTLIDLEAPVPAAFVDNQAGEEQRPQNAGMRQLTMSDFFADLASKGSRQELAFRSREPSGPVNGSQAWSVYCNECDVPMSDAHFHCSICDGGDYDLCEACVAGGKLCPGEGHWLIKRSIKNGKVITSTTERVGRKSKTEEAEELEVQKGMPGAFTEGTKSSSEEVWEPTRTCNCCVVVLPENSFVTCMACPDYDLCIPCHTKNQHGHHPAHGFKPATDAADLSLAANSMLAPGRHVRHNAICDGCDKKIYGVRHKCLNCPDWDYCTECVKTSRTSHPRHRFAAIYEPIADQHVSQVRHYGIYCDGPLCNNKAGQSYIQGVRYKCAVCHDTDFCANCEAMPNNHHNRTHPLIQFKTPVRNVSITTMNEDVRGNVRRMGDARDQTQEKATETTPIKTENAATQVQIVADFKPTEETEKAQPIPIVKSEEKSEPIQIPGAEMDLIPASLLNAHFVQDSIPDGMSVSPSARFTQIWTLRNPGPYAWPSGCSVRFVGGDNMLNVDNDRPASVTDIADATESNVVGREVQIGEEVAFKVVLKAPTREGKSISYWRLKAADGTPFGHRLWCDVEIKHTGVEVPKSGEHIEFKPATNPVAQGYQPIPSHETLMRGQASRLDALRAHQQRMTQHQQMAQQMQQHVQYQQAQRQAQVQQYSLPQRSDMQPPSYGPTIPPRAGDYAWRIRQAQRDSLLANLASGTKGEEMPSWGQPQLSESSQTFKDALSTAEETTRNETARKASAKERVETIKAKILKSREEKAKNAHAAKERAVEMQKAHIAQLEAYKQETDAKLKAEAEEKEAAKKIKAEKDAETVKKIVEAASANETLEGSQMIFPTLEKESPASSTYQSMTSSGKGKAAYVENEEGKVESVAAPATAPSVAPSVATVATPTEQQDDFEHWTDDLEVLSADDEEDSDDGFLTDEEYDILDASDQETVASP